MNRNQERQLDDLVRRFSAGHPAKPDTQPLKPKVVSQDERAHLSPKAVLILSLLAAILIGLLIAF